MQMAGTHLNLALERETSHRRRLLRDRGLYLKLLDDDRRANVGRLHLRRARNNGDRQVALAGDETFDDRRQLVRLAAGDLDARLLGLELIVLLLFLFLDVLEHDDFASDRRRPAAAKASSTP